jgi:hypothetical protein
MSEEEREDLRGMIRTLIQRMDHADRNRDDWRSAIKGDLDELKKQIAPVVRDHQFIFMAGKWIVGACAAVWAVVEAWLKISDRLSR